MPALATTDTTATTDPTKKPAATTATTPTTPKPASVANYSTDFQLGNMTADQGGQLSAQAPVDPLAFTTAAGVTPQNRAPAAAPTSQYQAPGGTPAPAAAPTGAGTVAPPQYTGPQYQAQNTAGLFYSSQNPNDGNWVFDDQSGNLVNKTTGQAWTGQDDYSQAHPGPLSGMSEADKNRYWATQGADVNLPGFENQGQPGYQAALAAYRSDPASLALRDKVQGAQASGLSDRNELTQKLVAEQGLADRARTVDALNNQAGYAGSGMDYLDPNKQGGTIANPRDRNHMTFDEWAQAQGQPTSTVTSTAVQTAPTSQGGKVTYTSGGGRPDTPGYTPPGGASGGTPGTYAGNPNASASLAPVMTKVDPANDLRSQQITPGEGIDRFKLANEQFDTYSKSTDPAFQLALRRANEAAAATGRLGSGMLRTSFGDLGNQRSLDLQNERDKLFQDALSGSVQDAQTRFQDLMQEQGYQTGAQNQAFNQNVTGQTLQNNLTNSAFQRALQMMQSGYSGDPGLAMQYMSALESGNAEAANQALQKLLASMGQNSTKPKS